MIIKEIELENLRSHKLSRIDFTPGINVITGNTGSGKSSILMAVEYALFGKIGEGREEGKLLLRRGATDGSIELSAQEKDDVYKIVRGLKRVKDAVRNDDGRNRIEKDGKVLDLQNRATDLNVFINKLLKIESSNPIKTFEAITYIKQDELKDLIFETGQTKQEYIDQLLQLNKYADVYDRMKEIVSGVSNQIELDRREASAVIDDNEIIKTETKINEITSTAESLSRRLDFIKSEIRNGEADKEGVAKEIETIRRMKSEYDSINTEINGRITQRKKLESQAEEIKKRLAELNGGGSEYNEDKLNMLKESRKEKDALLADRNKALKESYGKRVGAESMYQNTLNNAKKAEEELTLIKSELERRTKLKEELSKKLESASKLMTGEEISGRSKQLIQDIDELKKEMQNSLETGICAVCGTVISDKAHVEGEYSSKIERYEKMIVEIGALNATESGESKDQIKRNFDTNEIRMEQLQERMNTASASLNIDGGINELKEALEAAKGEYEKCEADVNILSKDIRGLDTEIAGFEAVKKRQDDYQRYSAQIQTLNANIEETERDLLDLKSKLDSVHFKSEDLTTGERRYEAMINSLRELDADRSKTEREIEIRKNELEENKARLKEIEDKIQKKKEMTKRIQREERMLKLLAGLREDIRSIREYVRNKFINDFKSLFQTRFSELRTENDYAIDIDGNYNLLVISKGEVLDAKTLSGGEKTSVALAYRLALSSIASLLGGAGKNEMILMDEPTSGLDKEDINSLTNAITRINDLKQIVIVTHEENMKNIADNLIMIRKDSGESRVYVSGG